MSTKKTRIDEELEKTLRYLDKEERLQPDPYFFTRLRQRMEEEHKKKITFQTVLKPALLTLIIIANLGTAVWQYDSYQDKIQKERREKLMEVFIGQQANQNNETNILGLN